MVSLVNSFLLLSLYPVLRVQKPIAEDIRKDILFLYFHGFVVTYIQSI
jgi:hypothetical protein